jgi:hydroxylaminobenzene mutase
MRSPISLSFMYGVKHMNKDQFIKTIQENKLSRQGHRLLQVGVALFLFASLEGFAIPYLAAPRLGLSVHTLSALQGVLLLALGLMWHRLNLGTTMSRIAFWLLIYSAFAILAAYVMAAAWGAGNETMRLAAGSAHGSAFQEAVIRDVAYSSAPTGLISFALILWGLRIAHRADSGNGSAVLQSK